MYNAFLKKLTMLMLLLSTGFYLAACGGGGGGDDSPSNGDSVTTPSLQSSTVTGVLATQTSAISKLMDFITPTSAIALVPATIYLDDSPSPIFANAQDRFTITNVQNGDHSLYIVMGDETEMEFPFRMAAGRGLDFGTMTLDGGQVRTFNGFNGYHFGWVDEDGDGTNDNFADVNGDGICDQGYRFAGYAYRMDLGYIDANNDGMNDLFIDEDGDGVNDLTGHSYGFGFGFIDEDGDGINDRFVDVDGDGISDQTGMPYQHPFGWSDANDDGVNDRFTDNNGDGINDITGTHYVGMPGWVDLDGDGLNDFFADFNGDGINDFGNMTPYGHGFGWVDANGDGINDVFADKEGDGVNDFSGYHYDGGGYRMSQNFQGGMGMQNPTWPMGPGGGGMMNQ